MNEQPVKSEVYDERWLNAAWGDKANKELLEQDTLVARPRLARALSLANIKPKHKVLDLACGRGEMPVLAAEKGAYAVGLDYSFAALEFAKSLSCAKIKKSCKQLNIELIRSDACTLPFADNSFDRVTMLDIIEHLLPDQLESMFIEVRRILKPNGYAVIHTLPNRWVYDVTFPMLNLLSKKFPKEPRSESEKKIHINEQDIPKLYKKIRSCGLNQRIWLEQFMPAQARWNHGKDHYGDNRDTIYPAFLGPIGKALEIASHTPLKLILCNDIFGILWKGNKKPNIKLPLASIERIAAFTLSAKN
jgi:ubiquinone/menaquinone biosynthesis C-methylase UbiE